MYLIAGERERTIRINIDIQRMASLGLRSMMSLVHSKENILNYPVDL